MNLSIFSIFSSFSFICFPDLCEQAIPSRAVVVQVHHLMLSPMFPAARLGFII
jgi:hypothetical protein